MTHNALYEDFKTGPVQGRDGVLVGGNTDMLRLSFCPSEGLVDSRPPACSQVNSELLSNLLRNDTGFGIYIM